MVIGFHGTTELGSIVEDGNIYASCLVGHSYNKNLVTFLKKQYDHMVAKLAEQSKEPFYQDRIKKRGIRIAQRNLTPEELADLVEYCGYMGQDRGHVEFKEAKRLYFVWLAKNIQSAKNYAGENGHVLECNLPDKIVRPKIIPGECILVPWKVDLQYVQRVYTSPSNLVKISLLQALQSRKIEVVPY